MSASTASVLPAAPLPAPTTPSAPTGPTAQPGPARRAGPASRSPHDRSAPLVTPSVRAAWAWENRKARSRWYWPALAVLGAVGMAIGWSQYASYRAEFDAQGTTWLSVWGQGMLMMTMLFLPLLVGALIAQTSTGEHQGRNWQRMSANRLQGAMLIGKLLHMTQIALLSALMLLAELVVTGVLLGFNPAELGPYVARIIPITLAILAIELFVAWLGVIMTSFSSIMTTMMVTTLIGCAGTVMAPRISSFFPLSLITAACACRDLATIDSMSSIALTSAICAAWALVWAVMMRRAVTRVS